MRNFHFPGRSPVIARNAMCATSHPLATLAAVEMMRSGGNAIDAAITAAAVLGVVEPAMTGIGGDCFALIHKPGLAAPIAFNASGCAPAAATAQWYADKGIKSLEILSPHSVTVPGCIDGWATLLRDHGTKTFADVLAPAIDYADRGFPVAPRIAFDWERLASKINGNAGARMHLLKDGQVPKSGEIMRFPALAGTLKAIAAGGRDAFYSGAVARDIVAELGELGGLHTLEDFAAQKSNYVTPISVGYKGVDLFELPPNNQGIVALIMLKMLDRIGRIDGDATSAVRYHVMMEAARLAYAMRDAFVADPEKAKVPVAHMLDDTVIAELCRRIDLGKCTPDLGPVPRPAGSDTVYFTVADGNGMVVSFINSLFAGFGSGIVTRKTGVVLQNRGMGFVLDPKHPNVIAPRKRPMHTLVPAMALRDGKPAFSFGVMGGGFQPAGHAYVMTNMLDYGMDPQEAIDCPRVFFEGQELQIEQSVPAETAQKLKDMGHRISWRSEPWGGGQLIAFDHVNGTLIGASDPRKDGMALGF